MITLFIGGVAKYFLANFMWLKAWYSCKLCACSWRTEGIRLVAASCRCFNLVLKSLNAISDGFVVYRCCCCKWTHFVIIIIVIIVVSFDETFKSVFCKNVVSCTIITQYRVIATFIHRYFTNKKIGEIFYDLYKHNLQPVRVFINARLTFCVFVTLNSAITLIYVFDRYAEVVPVYQK